jgi:two-component sensor histidine kinase
MAGLIRVTAVVVNKQVRVLVRDDGIGLPESVSFENSPGFGMQIIYMLTTQIRGTIGIIRGNGTTFELEFTA